MKIVFVYILLCSDGSYYTGVTSQLYRRINAHQSGKYPRSYTFSRRPLELVYLEFFISPFKAIRREKQIKGWSRAKKEALINGDINQLKLLAKRKRRLKPPENLSCWAHDIGRRYFKVVFIRSAMIILLLEPILAWCRSVTCIGECRQPSTSPPFKWKISRISKFAFIWTNLFIFKRAAQSDKLFCTNYFFQSAENSKPQN